MNERDARWYIKQLRIMASRGRIDDQDVVVLADAADEFESILEALEGEFVGV